MLEHFLKFFNGAGARAEIVVMIRALTSAPDGWPVVKNIASVFIRNDSI